MGTIHAAGEGGQVWEFDADLPYVVEQLASGALVPVDPPSDDEPVQKRRGRPPKADIDGDE